MNRAEVFKLIGESDAPNTTSSFMLWPILEPIIKHHKDKVSWNNQTIYKWLVSHYGFINAYKEQELIDTSEFTWAQIPEIKNNVVYLLFNHRHSADYTRFEREYILANHQFVDCLILILVLCTLSILIQTYTKYIKQVLIRRYKILKAGLTNLIK